MYPILKDISDNSRSILYHIPHFHLFLQENIELSASLQQTGYLHHQYLFQRPIRGGRHLIYPLSYVHPLSHEETYRIVAAMLLGEDRPPLKILKAVMTLTDL